MGSFGDGQGGRNGEDGEFWNEKPDVAVESSVRLRRKPTSVPLEELQSRFGFMKRKIKGREWQISPIVSVGLLFDKSTYFLKLIHSEYHK